MSFVILLRHGIAEDPGSMPDEERALTKKGRARMKEIAKGLRKIMPKIDKIYSSPLLRARQTAKYVGKFEIADELRPGGDGARNLIGDQNVILVGHEPTLTQLMLELTGVQGSFELKKGGCYGIRDGKLVWILSPRVLRRVR